MLTLASYDDLGQVSLQCFFFFQAEDGIRDQKSTRLNSSPLVISYAVFCLKKKTLQSSHLSTPYALFCLEKKSRTYCHRRVSSIRYVLLGYYQVAHTITERTTHSG